MKVIESDAVNIGASRYTILTLDSPAEIGAGQDVPIGGRRYRTVALHTSPVRADMLAIDGHHDLTGKTIELA